MSRQVFQISKESTTIRLKPGTSQDFIAPMNLTEYGFTPEIGVEDYEIDGMGGAKSHEQTTWDGKHDFKVMGLKSDPLQVFLNGVANGSIFGSANTIDVEKINYITGKKEVYSDCLVSDVTMINGKVNDLYTSSFSLATNGFPVITDVTEG